MSELNLVFDIHGYRPSWVQKRDNVKEFEKDFYNSRYRIYVNNDLIVERNWVWENDIFLRENMWIIVESSEFNLKLEPIIYNPTQIKFLIKNPMVNNIPIDFNSEQLELSIKV